MASSPSVSSQSDRMWMARALEVAQAGSARGEVPVGAVVVKDGHLIAEAHNATLRDNDPTAHAEVLAIRRAARLLGDWRLLDATLYVTLEPCAQCAGAIVLARVPRVVFAASDPKAGMAGSLGNLLQDDRLNHQAELTSGLFAEEAAHQLKGFFRERRR